MTVQDNPEFQRYEMTEDGELAAFTQYHLRGDVADFVHTETLDRFEGRGLGSQLIRGALDAARARAWQVRPICPFVKTFIGKHPEYSDLVPADERAHFGLA